MLNPRHSRGMMKFVKKTIDDNIIGAEIGVAEGFHVFKYLKTNKKIQKIYLVDPYEEYEMDGKHHNYSSSEKNAKKRLSIFKKKLVWVKKTSKDASPEVPDNLDFVYIDANHSYQNTSEDIFLWYKKIRKGGILGGHDFSASFPGVAKAVIHFTEKNNLELHGSGSDWWVIKGC